MHAQYPTTFEHRLLKMILEEVSLTWLARSPDDHARGPGAALYWLGI